MEELLFYKGDWSSVAESQKQRMNKEIAAKNGDQLLNTSTDDLALYCATEYEIEVPELDRDNIAVDQRETKIDVSRDTNRFINNRSKPFYVTGTAIDVEVPFQGDFNVFNIQPTTHTMNPPRGAVSSGFLKFTIQGTNLTGEQVQSEINGRIDNVDKYLGWLRETATPFNDALLGQAKEQIEVRKKKLLSDRDLVSGLGFKMRPREGEATTYTAPVRRKITPKPQAASTAPYKPEPVLEASQYEHILGVLENMASVMEQSPKAFHQMDEEALRTHFLVQLNGHYEGNATGETFNFEGKTDILIKADGKNIFIGECKFWTGEKGFAETIDQLLGYVSWRDTKAAVLVFNRNKDFSGVLETIKDSTPKHPNCKKLIKQMSETSWGYLFSQKGDPNREMTVSIQAYNIPLAS